VSPSCLLALLPFTLTAQKQKKFDPARFQAELEQFITTEAGLTPQEASEFFPVYREMMRKQRVYFDQMRRYQHIDITNDRVCDEAIRKMDEMDVEIKQIQQVYHQRFLQVLPAGKVMQVIQAENKFHRRAFKRVAGPPQGEKTRHPAGKK